MGLVFPISTKVFLASLVTLFTLIGLPKQVDEPVTPPMTVATSTTATTTGTSVQPLPAKIVPRPTATSTAASSTGTLRAVTLKTSTPPSETPPTDRVAEIESRVHLLVNAERKKNGLPALTYSTELATIARLHSADMLAKGYFSHSDQNACNSGCRLTTAGYEWSAVGENIYRIQSSLKLSPEKIATNIVAGWMASPGHRANILSTLFSEQGIGVANANGIYYTTEDFAHPR